MQAIVFHVIVDTIQDKLLNNLEKKRNARNRAVVLELILIQIRLFEHECDNGPRRVLREGTFRKRRMRCLPGMLAISQWKVSNSNRKSADLDYLTVKVMVSKQRDYEMDFKCDYGVLEGRGCYRATDSLKSSCVLSITPAPRKNQSHGVES